MTNQPADDQTVSPVYPMAMYFGVPVFVTDCEVMQSGKKNVKIETADGSKSLVSGPHWVGGEGYIYVDVSDMWTAIENVTLRTEIKPRCDHTIKQVVEIECEEQIGFSGGEISYHSNKHLVSKCMNPDCGMEFEYVPEIFDNEMYEIPGELQDRDGLI